MKVDSHLGVDNLQVFGGRFPFAFRQAFAKESPISNLWKYPELVLVDWETGGSPDEEMSLDETMLAFKQRLGIAPFRLNAARLRIQPSLQTYREDFYQTLAVSMWANAGIARQQWPS